MAHKFQGRRSTGATPQATKVPHHPDNLYHRFYFMNHEDGWEVAPLLTDEGDQAVGQGGRVQYVCVPVLVKFKLIPGVNGIRQGKTDADGPDYASAKARREDQGWRFIPVNALDAFPSFGVSEPGGYVAEWDGARGTIYSDIWTRPVLRGRGKDAKVSWTFDRVGYQRFRIALVEQGIIPLPDAQALETKIKIQANRAERHMEDVHVPKIAAKVERETQKLLAMEQIRDQVEDNGAIHTAEDADGPLVQVKGKRKAAGPKAPPPRPEAVAKGSRGGAAPAPNKAPPPPIADPADDPGDDGIGG
jgi:hypothetical protein